MAQKKVRHLKSMKFKYDSVQHAMHPNMNICVCKYIYIYPLTCIYIYTYMFRGAVVNTMI